MLVDGELYQKNVRRRILCVTPDNPHMENWRFGRLGYEVAFFKPHKALKPRGAYILVYD